MTEYSGIKVHRNRRQPYTVWVEGEVIRFTASHELAVAELVHEVRYRLQKREQPTAMAAAFMRAG